MLCMLAGWQLPGSDPGTDDVPAAAAAAVSRGRLGGWKEGRGRKREKEAES